VHQIGHLVKSLVAKEDNNVCRRTVQNNVSMVWHLLQKIIQLISEEFHTSKFSADLGQRNTMLQTQRKGLDGTARAAPAFLEHICHPAVS
jgi:hypothetical protein